MEVQYQKEEEEEEVNGVDLQTRRKSTPYHQKKSYSSSGSSESIVTSESSDSSLKYSSVSMNTTTTRTSSNNGITTINGENNKIIGSRSESEQAVEDLSQADDAAEFEETKTRDNYINISQNQESNGVESLLDESPNSINVTLSEKHYVENIVNKTLIVNSQNEIVETGPSQEIEPELEFDVETVIQKQKTHDFVCPNCNSCITGRVILKRRKRKTPEPDPPVLGGKDTENEKSENEGKKDTENEKSENEGKKDTENEKSENEGKKDTEDPGACFGAVSCFSCFSIFIPKGDRVLWWRFKPKTDVSQQQEKSFPLWILTCCQPSHIEKPVTDNQLSDNEVSPSPSHDGSVPPKSEPPAIADPGNQLHPQLTPISSGTDNNHVFPLWFLSCCQPSSYRVKQEHSPKPDTPVHSTQPPTTINTDTKLPPGSQPPVTDDEDGSVPSKSEPPTIADPAGFSSADHVFPLWFLSCCQPSSARVKQEHSPKPEHFVVGIDEEPPTQSHPFGTGSESNQHSLLPPTHPRTGVSGLDIIKAIVYGGLVECITSLSVISSAAAGDATTLNIVALGLANVFGGLLVLLHNVRVLKHEHSEDRYKNQLGSPDHYLLHTVVAVLSYLIFGLLSPVIYGFSFHESDNKNYKLAALAAASLVCITVLSIGKAYVRSPPKQYIKTIFYYLSMGFMVSGIGYVCGNLINMLLKKLGVFDSTAPVTMPGLEAAVVKGPWSSY